MVYPGSLQILLFRGIAGGAGRDKPSLTLFTQNKSHRFFLVNSKPPKFIRNSPKLWANQVALDPANYKCLWKDFQYSYLNCTEIIGKHASEIDGDMGKTGIEYLTIRDLERVRAVVRESEVLTGREIDAILGALPGTEAS